MPDNVESEKPPIRERFAEWRSSQRQRANELPSLTSILTSIRLPPFAVRTLDRCDKWADQYPFLFGGANFKVGNTWKIDLFKKVPEDDNHQLEAGQSEPPGTTVEGVPETPPPPSAEAPDDADESHSTNGSQAAQSRNGQPCPSHSTDTVQHLITAPPNHRLVPLPPQTPQAAALMPASVPLSSPPPPLAGPAPILSEGGRLTTLGAANTLSGELFGISLTVLPNAFETLGIGTGFIFFTLAYIQYIVSSMIIWHVCMRYPGRVKSVTDLVRMLFPRNPRIACIFTFCLWVISLELIASAHILAVGSIVAFLIGHESDGEYGQRVFPWKVIVGNLLATIMGYSLTSRRHIRQLSTAVITALFLVFLAMVWCLIALIAQWKGTLIGARQVHWWWNADTTGTAKMVAILKIHFTFFVQQNVPGIVNKMRNPENFPKALHLSGIFLFVCLSIHATLSCLFVTLRIAEEVAEGESKEAARDGIRARMLRKRAQSPERKKGGVDPYIIANLRKPHSLVVGCLLAFPAMTQVGLLGSIFMIYVSTMLDESRYLNNSEFCKTFPQLREKIPSVIIALFWLLASLESAYIPNIKTMMALVASTTGFWLIYYIEGQALWMMLRADRPLPRIKLGQRFWRRMGWLCMGLFFLCSFFLVTYGSYSAGVAFKDGIEEGKNKTKLGLWLNKTNSGGTDDTADADEPTKPKLLPWDKDEPDIDEPATGNLTAPALDAGDDKVAIWDPRDKAEKDARKKDRKQDRGGEEHQVEEADQDDKEDGNEDAEEEGSDRGKGRGKTRGKSGGKAGEKGRGEGKGKGRGKGREKDGEQDDEQDKEEDAGQHERQDKDRGWSRDQEKNEGNEDEERGPETLKYRTQHRPAKGKPPAAAATKPKRSMPILLPFDQPWNGDDNFDIRLVNTRELRWRRRVTSRGARLYLEEP